jgi:hypothetical protein
LQRPGQLVVTLALGAVQLAAEHLDFGNPAVLGLHRVPSRKIERTIPFVYDSL